MLRKLWFNLAYLGKPVWDTGVSPQELIDFIAAQPPGRALDIGCGTGTNVITLAKHGWQVIGIDFSGRAIRAARRKALDNAVHVELLHEDVTRLQSLHDKFDLILDIGCFHSLPEEKRPAYLANIERLLAETGTFLLYAFINPSPGSPGPGITDADLQFISQKLHIVDRKDGTERGFRPSAWLSIKKRGVDRPS